MNVFDFTPSILDLRRGDGNWDAKGKYNRSCLTGDSQVKGYFPPVCPDSIPGCGPIALPGPNREERRTDRATYATMVLTLDFEFGPPDPEIGRCM